jgi:dienelactone hydrolase
MMDKMERIDLKEILLAGEDRHPVNADLRSCDPSRPLPLIIICHGFLGYKRWGFFPHLSERLAGAGFHVLTMSFSLNGVDEDTGRIVRADEFASNTVGRELEDLEMVCRSVREGYLPLPVMDGQWGLCGYSRGAAVSILAAPGFPEIRSLVTWATPSRFDRYTEKRKACWKHEGALVFTDSRADGKLRLDYSYYEDIAQNSERYDLIASKASLSIPHLMVHGERDAAVTLKEAKALLGTRGRSATRLEIIRGCGHTFGASHPMPAAPKKLEEAIGLTIEWFRSSLQ